jgi:hypothetical protein
MVFGIASASETMACAICIGFPSRTEADVLIDGHCLMLVRADPNDPFQYAPGLVLKGTYDGSKFDLLVDSATQRTLDAHPNTEVLLVQESANGPWRSLGCLNKPLESLVRRILMVCPTWTGSQGGKDRIDFFVSLMESGEPRIRELAYLELGRAPYATVRQLGRALPRQAYEPMLQERRYLEWRGLAILLLAQSPSVTDRQRILDSFRSAEQNAVLTNLAAWTAAAIEVDSPTTLEYIEEEYFRSKDHSREELQAIFRAISMHGSREEPEIRERVIICYGRLLESHPEFAPEVAEDLHAWKRTDLSDALARIVEQCREGLDPTGIGKVRRYLQSAAAAAANGTGPLHD